MPAEHSEHQGRGHDPKKTDEKHLISYIRLEILLPRDVHAHTPVFQRCGADLVRRARHSRHDDVRERQAAREIKLGRRRAHDVMRVVRATRPCCGSGGRRGSLGIFLDRVDVDREDTRAVICEERRERAPNDLRSGGARG